MTDKKLAAQAYCVVAEKLESAIVILKDAKKVVDEIYLQLEDIRKQMGDDIKGETIVILLPKNMSVVVTNHNGYIEADISRTI